MNDSTDDFIENLRRLDDSPLSERARRRQQNRTLHKRNGSHPMPRMVDPNTAPNVIAWATTIYTEEIAKLASTGSGKRNATLNEVALRLARIGIDRDWLQDSLYDACVQNGHVADDGDGMVYGTIQSAFDGADQHGPADDIPEPDLTRNKSTKTQTGAESEEHPTPIYAGALLTRSDLLKLPDPEPLIHNVLDQGTVALLYGSWGTAKTFTALDWAASVATGKEWMRRTTQQRKVLYVVGEGAFGFKGRIDAWENSWGKTIPDESLHILPAAVNLTKAVDLGNLQALIEWNGYGFVILDTLARCMVGADENSAKDCGTVVDALTKLLAATPNGRGVILGVHHAGKDSKTFRGSSVFEAGADTSYFTSRDDETGVITLRREKRKDGPAADVHELILDQVPLTGSCVLAPVSAVQHPWTSLDKPARTDELLSIFVQHFGATGASKSELRQVADLAPSTFHRALSYLLKHGELVNHGTDSRTHLKLP